MRAELAGRDGILFLRNPSRFCFPRFQAPIEQRHLVPVSQVVEGKESTSRQHSARIVGQYYARSLGYSQAFECCHQIRDRWELIKRVPVLFNQLIEPDKTRTRYVSGIELS